MEAVDAADALWKASFVVAVLPLLLMIARERARGLAPVVLVTGGCIALLVVLQGVRSVALAVRWSLTLLGFAGPLAMSVVVTRYLVTER